MDTPKYAHTAGFFHRHAILSYFFLFFFVFVLLLLLHSKPTFPDPDSFYHARMAALMKEQGIVKDFPWTQFSVLKDYYIDHHFLYHLALVPFVWFLPPQAGVKIATVFFASLAITVFYWLLKTLGVRYSAFYTLVLFGTNAFIFRLNLAKAQALALVLLFFGIFLIINRAYLLLGFVSFVYVILYGGWPVLFLVAFAYSMVDIVFWFIQRKNREVGTSKSSKSSGVRSPFVSAGKFFVAMFAGASLAIITSPYFPKNLFFYWQQIFEIAVVNYREIIGVGGEWYAYQPLHLIAHANMAFLFFVIGLTFFVLNFKKQNRESVFFLVLTALFLVLTLRARRNVEYLIPFAILFSAVSIELFLRGVNFRHFLVEFTAYIQQRRSFLVALIFPLALLPYVVVRDFRIVKNAYDNGFRFDHFKNSSEWLKNNSNQGDIVFTSDWDEFPFLFYYNLSNYYIVGLDPTFMYQYDKDLYWKWERVTTVRESRRVYDIIKNDFSAQYVFVSLAEHESFDKVLRNNFHFEKVYADEEAKVYKVL